jgi:hypothetical protein
VALPAAVHRCRTAHVEAAAPARRCMVGEDVPDAWWLVVVVAQVGVHSGGLARVAAAGRTTTSAAADSHFHYLPQRVRLQATGKVVGLGSNHREGVVGLGMKFVMVAVGFCN